MEGLEGKIDALGRILIPIKYRTALRLTENTKIKLTISGNSIIITPMAKKCLICGNQSDLNQKFNLCNTCVNKVKNGA